MHINYFFFKISLILSFKGDFLIKFVLNMIENNQKHAENHYILDNEIANDKEKNIFFSKDCINVTNYGYAILKGANFSYLIQATVVVLGRGIYEQTDKSFIGLGEYKKISRKHAKIEWIPSIGNFKLQNIGKNAILVNRIPLKPNEVITLSSRMPIKIGPICFYFLLAI